MAGKIGKGANPGFSVRREARCLAHWWEPSEAGQAARCFDEQPDRYFFLGGSVLGSYVVFASNIDSFSVSLYVTVFRKRWFDISLL